MSPALQAASLPTELPGNPLSNPGGEEKKTRRKQKQKFLLQEGNINVCKWFQGNETLNDSKNLISGISSTNNFIVKKTG